MGHKDNTVDAIEVTSKAGKLTVRAGRAPSPAAPDFDFRLLSIITITLDHNHRHRHPPHATISSDWGSSEVCPPNQTSLETAPKPFSTLFDNLTH